VRVEALAMRVEAVGWSVLLAAVISAALMSSTDRALVGAVFLERIAPLLFAPMFAGVFLEDRKQRMHELALSAPHASRIQARKLALVTAVALSTVVVAAMFWHTAVGLSFGVCTLAAVAPLLALGALAYGTSVLSLSEAGAFGAAFLVWGAEQMPGVHAVFAALHVQALYLFPLSVAGERDIAAGRLVLCAVAFMLLAVSVRVLGRTARPVSG
jgi:hypothetical protein